MYVSLWRGTATKAFKWESRVLGRLFHVVSHFDCSTRVIYHRGLSYEDDGHIKPSGLHRQSSLSSS